jgi:asparagine synthase (glutamine-hydrolysing)
MCGIFGIWQHMSDTVPDRQRLEISASLMHHRGPDHYGIFADDGIGLVNTRLSLMDLAPRSNQPFWDRQRRYALIYNGEIYNYRELQSELEEQGVEFKTTSDTEVLLECLIHHGVEATLPRLEGMFAFALYDTCERMLALARDRFGIKPLFVYDGNDTFLFASEVRAMRPWITFQPDILSISAYLQGFGEPSKGYSFYKDVKIIAPGTLITLHRGERARYSRFFSMSDFWDEAQTARLTRLRPKQLVDEVEERLLDSVKMQLVADAPVGALCSGGVDSSIMLAMASKFHNNLAIFHANVAGPDSEYESAVALARYLKLDLKTVEVIDQDFIDAMPEVTQHYGQPFSHHPNSVPFLLVSKLVRSNGVKAVLSGEGSDECYIGYPWLIFNLSAFIRQLLREPYPTLRRLIMGLLGRQHDPPPEVLICGLHNRFETIAEKEEIRTQVERISQRTIRDQDLTSLYELSYHLRTLLHRNDGLGMAASIEARFPFLNSRLVKLAVNMPYHYKVRFSPTVFYKHHYFLRDKWVLRKVAERYLPAELAQRTKWGFRTTAQSHMQIPAEFFEGLFVADLFGLSMREIHYLVNHAPQELKLKLLHLEVWAHVCLHDAPREQIVRRLREHVSVRRTSSQHALQLSQR